MTNIQGSWLHKLLARLHDGMDGDDDNHQTLLLTWIFEWLSKERAQATAAAAEKLGWIAKDKKMNEIEAAAMWTDANITKQARLTILKHLRAKFGATLQVPNAKVETLAEDDLPVFSGQYSYKKNIEDKPETISYWISNVGDVVAKEVERCLESEYAELSRGEKRNTDITFGYCTKVRGAKKGIDVITGADHGKGALRFIVKLNLSSPQYRRAHGFVEEGCPIRQFGCVECAHDDAAVIAKVSGCYDDGVKTLDNSMVVGVRNKVKGLVQTLLLPHDATEIQLKFDDESSEEGCRDIVLNFKARNGELVKKELRKEIGTKRIENICWWIVVEKITTFATGDLAFYASIHGRDGASGFYCPYCDASHTEMNQNECSREKRPLTISYLHNLMGKNGVERRGVKMAPLCPSIEPGRCTIPLLHCMMGMVNKCWDMLMTFIDNNVEVLPEDEQLLRNQMDRQKLRCKALEDQIQQKTKDISLNFGRRIGANKQLREMQKKNKNLHPSLLQVGLFGISILQVRDDLNNQLEIDRAEKARLEGMKRDERLELSKTRKDVKTAKTERLKKDGGISSKAEQILFEEANVNKAAYHGGQFEGGSCIRILDNNSKIMEELKSVCDLHLQIPREHRDSCSQEELDAQFKMISNLFLALDAAFSLLRLVKPTDDEIKETKKAVSVLQNL